MGHSIQASFPHSASRRKPAGMHSKGCNGTGPEAAETLFRQAVEGAWLSQDDSGGSGDGEPRSGTQSFQPASKGGDCPLFPISILPLLLTLAVAYQLHVSIKTTRPGPPRSWVCQVPATRRQLLEVTFLPVSWLPSRTAAVWAAILAHKDREQQRGIRRGPCSLGTFGPSPRPPLLKRAPLLCLMFF